MVISYCNCIIPDRLTPSASVGYEHVEYTVYSVLTEWYDDITALLSWNEHDLRWLFIHSFMDILNFIINLFINYLISIKLLPFIAFVCEFIVIAEYITNLNWIIIHINKERRIITIYISLFQATESIQLCLCWTGRNMWLWLVLYMWRPHLAKSLSTISKRTYFMSLTSSNRNSFSF